MTIVDLEDPASPSRFRGDVCVVGSGPAGMSVAGELAAAGHRVVIAEAGGFEEEPSTTALQETEDHGQRRRRRRPTRARRFGGSSTLWTGRVAPFADEDHRARPWVPHSGWPYSADDLEPHLQRAAPLLEVASGGYDVEGWWRLAGPRPEARFDEGLLVEQLFQFSEDPTRGECLRFDHRHRAELQCSERIEVVLHANVKEVRVPPTGDRATGVEVQTLSGRAADIEAPRVILAAGGIENARLLLASRSVVTAGLGNDHDLVGRFLMDHPHACVRMGREAAAVWSRLGQRWFQRRERSFDYLAALRLSPRAQRRHGLLNCLLHFEHGDPDSPSARLGRLLRRDDSFSPRAIPEWAALLRRTPALARAAQRRLLQRQPPIPLREEFELGVFVEQVPDPENRVSLSDARDALGMPKSRIHWQMHPLELETVRWTLSAFQRELHRLGLPAVERAAWLDAPDEETRSHFIDRAHPTGTTRIARDPRAGVADPWGRVHGVEGLYVVGSSTFPTSGVANPTLMILATALRTADAVHDDLQRDAPVLGPPRENRTVRAGLAAGPFPPRVRVALVGTGERSSRVYAPILERLRDRFEVTGVAGRSREKAQPLAARLGAVAHDDVDAMAAGLDFGFFILAVPPRAVPGILAALLRRPSPILLETPPAWSAWRLAALSWLPLRGAQVGVAEQVPFDPLTELATRVARGGHLGRIVRSINDGYRFDYHGIAAARRLLGPLARPRWATATEQRVQLRGERDPKTTLEGTVHCSDGASLQHRFGETSALPGAARSLRLEGEHFRLSASFGRAPGVTDAPTGEAVSLEVHRSDSAGAPEPLARVQREVDPSDRLVGVRVDVDGARVEWSNPFARWPFSGEEIAVARHLEAMRAVVLRSGAPLYPLREAITDMEIVLALRRSARRRGKPVSLPDARRKARDRLR